jgi:hypothetical protein
MTANLISTGMRLVPLGQTDGQRVLAALEPVAPRHAARALTTPLDEVGGRLRPISPACITKPSTLGCSGADHCGRLRAPGIHRR